MERHTIQFETNVEDLVDANERYWKQTSAGQSQRRRGIFQVAAAFTISVFAVAFISTGAHKNAIVPVVVVALVIGVAFWPLYSRLYDSGFNRRLRRVLTQQAGTDTTWMCEIELRKEGVWSRSRGIEYLFHWQQLSAIEDTGDAVAFHFNGGFVVARNRAFPTDSDRARFLDTARTLAAN